MGSSSPYQGSLPAGVDHCQLDIMHSQCRWTVPVSQQSPVGQWCLLDTSSSKLCRFQYQLTVEIQHCAKMTNSTKLSFVRAHRSQESLPYTFKQLEGRGSFTEHSSYGSLELNHFSGLAVTGEDVERVYTASLYYLGSELHSRQRFIKRYIVSDKRRGYKLVPSSQACRCSPVEQY